MAHARERILSGKTIAGHLHISWSEQSEIVMRVATSLVSDILSMAAARARAAEGAGYDTVRTGENQHELFLPLAPAVTTTERVELTSVVIAFPQKLVAFSCKRRGFCPACGARRMAETAAHLPEHVSPQVPVRQWVGSFPIPLRHRFATQPHRLSPLLQVIHPARSTFVIHQAGLTHAKAQSGAVTLSQVAMYLVKRLCDLRLQETAAHLGVESYGVVG